jgi:hypothetical protein
MPGYQLLRSSLVRLRQIKARNWRARATLNALQSWTRRIRSDPSGCQTAHLMEQINQMTTQAGMTDLIKALSPLQGVSVHHAIAFLQSSSTIAMSASEIEPRSGQRTAAGCNLRSHRSIG